MTGISAAISAASATGTAARVVAASSSSGRRPQRHCATTGRRSDGVRALSTRGRSAYGGAGRQRGLAVVAALGDKNDNSEGEDGIALKDRILASISDAAVRLPAQFIVERIIAPLYPEVSCGPGRYVDPDTQSCALMCQPGYVWDPDTKSCTMVVSSASKPVVVSGHIPRVGEKARMGKELSPMQAPRKLPNEVERRWLAPGTWSEEFIRFCVNRLLGTNSECEVGFYFDKISMTCRPICAPGYVYDRRMKKCIKREAVLHD